MTTPPLRYLAAADVVACMPPLPDRIRLAERALIGLATGAELPAKIGVHPRPAESFVHAMPAHLRGDAADGSADLVGMKWIAGFPANGLAGLSALHGLVVVNDPMTGIPLAIMDGGRSRPTAPPPCPGSPSAAGLHRSWAGRRGRR
jgi:ornithine cyclodeaminase/alanine dehydrogenase-like protein (mu-crystallin family)